jgi:fluoride ion exporter CrcB/FEX
MAERILLTIDGIANLVLGLLLLVFPGGVVNFLGLPVPSTNFYVNLFGAVLVGIGLALFLQGFAEKEGMKGLGIQGAIVINFCGSGALLAWLSSGKLSLPRQGAWFLWGIALLVVAIALGEILFWLRSRSERRGSHQAT